jgi:hypothetical protein
LVGVVKRKRDFVLLERDLWYRIPVFAAPGCIDTEYVAFYHQGGVRAYAALTGYELVYRRDLLPLEYQHPRANDLYFKLQFREVIVRSPAILNPTHRVFAFLWTTWARLHQAITMADL